jgi:hypothetical protein
VISALAFTTLLAPSAFAVEERPWSLRSFTQGSPQVGMSGSLLAELRPRARVALDLGFAAPSWLEAYGRTIVGREWQPPVALDPFAVASSSSVLGGARFGWRPLARHGLVLDAGYRFVAVSGAEAGGFVGGPEGLPPPPVVGNLDLDVAKTLHLATVGLAWEQALARRVLLRVDVGGVFVVAATRAGVTEVVDVARPADLDAALLGPELSGRLTSAVATPRVGVALGWRFF